MARVFQYGSNTSEARINGLGRLKGDAKYLYNAETVQDYELDFTVWSETNQCAAVDIVLKQGSKVWGVVYDVPDYLIRRDTAKRRERKSLDAIEGEGTNYKRILIEVKKGDRKIVETITYVAKSKCAGLETSYEYVKHIIKGLEEHDIPESYVRKVKRKIVENNPDLNKYF